MKYSSVKGLYEVFGLENMDFEDFCWHLYKKCQGGIFND